MSDAAGLKDWRLQANDVEDRLRVARKERYRLEMLVDEQNRKIDALLAERASLRAAQAAGGDHDRAWQRVHPERACVHRPADVP